MDTGILLMPFEIDAYGSLGPVARKLLYEKDHTLTAYHNGETISDIEEACQEANRIKHKPICHPGSSLEGLATLPR